MTNIKDYKCPNCGAHIPFDPTVSKLKCQYCDSEYDIETLDLFDEASVEYQDHYQWHTNQGQVEQLYNYEYTCPSCGGSVFMNEENSASICPYCGGSIILSSKVEGGLKPNLVIPFKITKHQAIEALQKELTTKFLLPKDFKSNEHLDKVQGLYVPYWLFDCDADCLARFSMENYSTWRQGDYQYHRTDYYLGVRQGKISFKKVPVDASLKIEEDILNAIEPFDYDQAVNFNTAYLAGFYADIRQEDQSECIKKANKRIKNSMITELQNTVRGYQSCHLTNSAISFDNGISHYAMLPVYLLSKQYHDKVYTFAINGQSGKVAGDLPTDYKKLALFTILVFALSFLIVAIIGYFLIGEIL